MRFYISRFPIDRGGTGSENLFYRAATLELRDMKPLLDRMLDFQRQPIRLGSKGQPVNAKVVPKTRLHLPPKGKGILKSKITPHLMIHRDMLDRATQLGGTKVPLEYIHVLCWLLKKEFYASYSGVEMDDATAKRFDGEIRAKRNILLRSSQWIDRPINEDQEILNNYIEKIDLGRRSALNYSSTQSEEAFDETEKFRKGPKSRVEPSISAEDIRNSEPEFMALEEIIIPPKAKSFRDYYTEKKSD